MLSGDAPGTSVPTVVGRSPAAGARAFVGRHVLGLGMLLLTMIPVFVASRTIGADGRTSSSMDIHSHIKDVATRYDVPENLVAAIVEIESQFNPRAVSPRGAQGLMQLMPATAATLGVDDPFDPRGNIEGGVRHLRSLMDRFDNNLPLVLAAYNAGERAVIAHRGIPPYRQTRQYVNRILRRLDRDAPKTSDTGQHGRRV